ncbi:MAG: hypothetical protein U9R28_04710 [Pseudomonadota bacterium]|nr:hypothetical protein [Pseudomonadota bacterium]
MQLDLLSQTDKECRTENFDHILDIVQDKDGDAFYNIPGAIQNPWPIDNSQCCKGRPGTLDKSETQFIINFVQTLGVTKENASDFIGTHIPYQHQDKEYEVFLLRNLPKTGIGLRYGEHDSYYPDFALFFKVKNENSGVVTLVDTKGLKSEMNEKGFSHYKYLSNMLSISEINSQIGGNFENWHYSGCFVSTSKIDTLSFPDIVVNNPSYKTAERYKNFGILFEGGDYQGLVDWSLASNRSTVEKVSNLIFRAQTEDIYSDDDANFPGGYIGLLFKTLVYFGLSEESAIKIVFEIFFEYDAFNASEKHIQEKLVDILSNRGGIRALEIVNIQKTGWLGLGKRSYSPLIKALMANNKISKSLKPETGYFGEADEQFES